MGDFTVKVPTAEVVANVFRNLVVILVIALTILGSVLYARVNNQQTVAVNAAEKILSSHCSFFRDLADAPVTVTKIGGQAVPPSKLGVKLVADSRNAYSGISCRPALSPNLGLIHWAHVYGISLDK